MSYTARVLLNNIWVEVTLRDDGRVYAKKIINRIIELEEKIKSLQPIKK